MNIKDFAWTREPEKYTVTSDRVEIITQPETDLWQRTYYHFRNDNAPVFQMETDEKYFSFVVKTDFTESRHRFDQCGIVMYLDSENWLKGSVEYENEEYQHLGSVVTNDGYSDWATTEISANIKTMWYRFSRREDDYCIECSEDGIRFRQMRICHMKQGAGKVRFGIYACSPEKSSFKAVFSDMQLLECKWKAHDGQKPDETKRDASLMLIRKENESDYERIYDVVKEAFESAEHADGNEQELVNALRNGDSYIPDLSLVAEVDGNIVGHIMFTKALVGEVPVLALAPLSVIPEYQRKGIGTALIKEGHRIAAELGFMYSIVLGSEHYYPRFGYVPADVVDIQAPFDVPRENFMAYKLKEDAPDIFGVMKYASEFGIE